MSRRWFMKKDCLYWKTCMNIIISYDLSCLLWQLKLWSFKFWDSQLFPVSNLWNGILLPSLFTNNGPTFCQLGIIAYKKNLTGFWGKMFLNPNLKIHYHNVHPSWFVGKTYQNLHWKLGRLMPSFGSILAVRLEKYFFVE